MLHDRDYMREQSFENRTSLAVKLVVLLIGLFIIQCCLQFYARLPLDDWFALSLQGFKERRYWQLLTFQFMHTYPLPWHVLFNCLGLWFFGRSVEQTLGSRQFLILYLASGLFGGIIQLLTIWALPLHFDAEVVGASAGVMGLLAAYATLYPMREITFFIVVFPVTLRAQYLLWLAFAWSLFGVIVPYSNVADAAHLGGLVFGVAYVRWGNNAQRQISRFSPFQSRQRKLELVKAASVSTLRSSRPRKDLGTELPSDEFISREVDPILDKISAHGIQSLTDHERQILEAARSRMSRR